MRNPKGRLELTWMGKDMAIIPAEHGIYDYEWVERGDPRACEVKTLELTDAFGALTGPGSAEENLLIVGDSGDALRSLGTVPEWSTKYLGEVKLVYIDPPFNTEQVFEHYADQLEHSIWLTMMRDRIRDIRPLLAPDSSVWVHLDDKEVHRMRVLLDEEFGPNNFVAEIVWQKADSPRNDAKGISGHHDTILVYRNSSAWSPNRMERTAEANARFSSPDGDPEPWFDGDPTAPGATKHQGMVYAVQHPITGKLHYPARGRCWWTDQAQLLAQMSQYAEYELRNLDDEAFRASLCGVEPDEVRAGVPAIMLKDPLEQARQTAQARYEQGNWPLVVLRSGGTGGFGRKSYIPTNGMVVSTWWSNDTVGHNREAKAEIKALFPGANPFSTPKPERLIERILRIGSDPGDLVLDFFAGSGTTAAVAHKMGRRWLAVELQESTAKSFIVPRLQKVTAGTDLGGITSTSERVADLGLDAEGNEKTLPDGVSPVEAQKFTALLARFSEDLEIPFDPIAYVSKAARSDGRSQIPALSLDERKNLLSLLRKLAGSADASTAVDLAPEAVRGLRAAAKTRKVTTVNWAGGGGFSVAKVGPSMYEVAEDLGMVFLSEAAVNGSFSKAVAGHLKFAHTPQHPVFVGVKGRQHLAVVDGVVDNNVVQTIVEALPDGARALVVGKAVLTEAEELLNKTSPGSRVKKAPQELFAGLRKGVLA